MKVAKVIGNRTGRGGNLTITEIGSNEQEFGMLNEKYKKRNPMTHLIPKKKKRK